MIPVNYYCPLSERKFNKSRLDDRTCSMKRCTNIQKTDKLLWETIEELILDISLLEEKLKKSINEKASFSSTVRKQRGKIKVELEKKEIELKEITEGIVSIESKRIMNEFTSDDVCLSLKEQMNIRFGSVHTEIENLKTH